LPAIKIIIQNDGMLVQKRHGFCRFHRPS